MELFGTGISFIIIIFWNDGFSLVCFSFSPSKKRTFGPIPLWTPFNPHFFWSFKDQIFNFTNPRFNIFKISPFLKFQIYLNYRLLSHSLLVSWCSSSLSKRTIKSFRLRLSSMPMMWYLLMTQWPSSFKKKGKGLSLHVCWRVFNWGKKILELILWSKL